jgi:UDP-N-acetylglucosamine 2-epimerase (non-hydrolysing)
MRILSVVGARPNFMKIAPVVSELRRVPEVEHCLVHTGQHYDQELSGKFFEELALPDPDMNLQVGSGSHTWQTAEVMKRPRSSESGLPTLRRDCAVLISPCPKRSIAG